jgi:golgi to ER traffic protein 4
VGASGDEILVTDDSLLNFAQLMVRTVQRAAGAQNKTAREAWVRLCGTYQARGGILTHPEVRAVCQPLLDLNQGLNLGLQVLNELAMLYFEIPLPRTTNTNPFGDIMSSFFGGPPGSGSASAQPRTITPGAGRAHLTLD